MSERTTNPIHPDVRRFACETNAVGVEPMMSEGSGRVVYDGGMTDIIHLGRSSDVPDGYQANLTLTPRITIDLFPH